MNLRRLILLLSCLVFAMACSGKKNKGGGDKGPAVDQRVKTKFTRSLENVNAVLASGEKASPGNNSASFVSSGLYEVSAIELNKIKVQQEAMSKALENNCEFKINDIGSDRQRSDSMRFGMEMNVKGPMCPIDLKYAMVTEQSFDPFKVNAEFDFDFVTNAIPESEVYKSITDVTAAKIVGAMSMLVDPSNNTMSGNVDVTGDFTSKTDGSVVYSIKGKFSGAGNQNGYQSSGRIAMTLKYPDETIVLEVSGIESQNQNQPKPVKNYRYTLNGASIDKKTYDGILKAAGKAAPFMDMNETK